MKTTLLTILLMANFNVKAFSTPQDVGAYANYFKEDLGALEKEMPNSKNDILYLTKTMAYQQRSYEQRIFFLENELQKTKQRLIEVSMNSEKTETFFRDQFDTQVAELKKEVAVKNRSILEYQRQLEKINPSEDFKNLVKLNTELASNLRKSENMLATYSFEAVQKLANKENALNKTRSPASNEEK